MANPKAQLLDLAGLVPTRVDQRAKEALSMHEICDALAQHFGHPSPTLHYMSDLKTMRPQILLETTHEATDGTKLRIATRFDADRTLVELVDVTNAH